MLEEAVPSSRFVAVVLWVPMLAWWLALYPGGWSNDSLDSWGQIQTGAWTNHHPVPFTAFVWLTSLGGHEPPLVSLAETLVVAVALAVLVRALMNAFGGSRAPFHVAVVLCVLPLLGPFASVVWKDIPELAALLVLQALLIGALLRPADLRRSWWLALGAMSLCVALLRWNGVATVIGAAIVAAVALKGRVRWQAPVVMAVTALLGFGVLLAVPLVSAVPKVSSADTDLEQLTDLADLARDHPALLSASDRAAMERVAPVKSWARFGGDCATPSTLRSRLFADHHLDGVVDRSAGALKTAWWSVAKRHLGTVLGLRVCRADLAWDPTDRPAGLHTVWTGVLPNHYGIADGGWPPLHRAAVRVVNVTHTSWAHALAWRPVLWLLAVAAAGVLAWRRRDNGRLMLLLLAVPLAAVGSFAIAPAAQSARYTYPAVVIAQLALAGRIGEWLQAWRERRTLASEA